MRKKKSGNCSSSGNQADRLKPYQWKPGQSGNPKGRPPDVPTVAARIKDWLACPARELPAAEAMCEVLGLDSGEVLVVDVLAAHLVNLGFGDGPSAGAALKTIIDRVEPPAAEGSRIVTIEWGEGDDGL